MVVVDSSVLIHLNRIGKLDLLKKFFGKIAITPNIKEEIKGGQGFSEIKKNLENWIYIKNPKNSDEIKDISKLEGIEKADASVILLAKEKKDILISNDKALIMVARSKNVECWWLTTFLLRCLDKRIISKKETKKILFDLIVNGMRLDNAVYAEILRIIENK